MCISVTVIPTLIFTDTIPTLIPHLLAHILSRCRKTNLLPQPMVRWVAMRHQIFCGVRQPILRLRLHASTSNSTTVWLACRLLLSRVQVGTKANGSRLTRLLLWSTPSARRLSTLRRARLLLLAMYLLRVLSPTRVAKISAQ